MNRIPFRTTAILLLLVVLAVALFAVNVTGPSADGRAATMVKA